MFCCVFAFRRKRESRPDGGSGRKETITVKKGAFAEALRYQQLYQKDYEKLLDEKKNRAVNEIQTRYETREKEAQKKREEDDQPHSTW